jgi:glycosyltransferase involved in cell wall biosynthesis/SAM-dependent methyltransferase
MRGTPAPEDLSVVIPTRGRPEILRKMLSALEGQSVEGFETVIVVDGVDVDLPHAPGAKVIETEHRGPGAARNTGARSVVRPIVLFLGDDMVPRADLVERHLDAHRDNPQEECAVLGKAEWHPDVARGRIQRWLDRSRSQFDYPPTACGDTGFGRFYSCNVSLKRDFFLESGGFDEDFSYYYEDLDCGWRLAQKGMRLVYEPRAVSEHLHFYDGSALASRFSGVATGEHTMTTKHAWFEPFFLGRVISALTDPRPSSLWPLVVDRVPMRAQRLRAKAVARADTWYYRSVSEPFLRSWGASEELAELRRYLGPEYDHSHLVSHQCSVDEERERVGDDERFYRVSREYLYDLTAFAMSATKAPYLAELRAALGDTARVLDYGCGIGADGLRLAAGGYDVSYADFANPSTEYLKWRLRRRGLEADVYDLDEDDIPAGFDAVYSFDVLEHAEDPFEFLRRLEELGALVAVNFLEERADDTDLHHELPIPELLGYAERRGLLRYRRYHGRSHFVVYRGNVERRGRRRTSRTRSRIERVAGRYLPGRRPWHPVPSTYEALG